MSTSSMRKKPRGNTRPAVDYEINGIRGTTTYNENIKNGTSRVAEIRCDHDSVEEFLKRSEDLAVAHGRQIETRSYVHSFSKEEMDRNDLETPDKVADLSYEYMKELHPNSDVLVIVHMDSKGGHPHSHCKVINHCNETGRALEGQEMYWQYQAVNDRVMRRNGLSVVQRGSASLDNGAVWESLREGGTINGYERKLGDGIKESLLDLRSVDTPSYRKVLKEKDIELVEREDEIRASSDGEQPARVSVGWTYKMFDDTTEKSRMRRRKASALSQHFTHKGAQRLFERNIQLNAERQAEQHGIHGQERADGRVGAGTQGIGLLTAEEVNRDGSIGDIYLDAEDRPLGPHDADERTDRPVRETADERGDDDLDREVSGEDLSAESIRAEFEERRREAAERTPAAEGSGARTEGPTPQQPAREAGQRGDRQPGRPRRTQYVAPDRGRDEGRGLGD
ncbi:relaxase/mobilization nuclease domain-containing protein [Nesterenkonia halotolerans]|uniref:MobA/VirD2-like nuclease domain-containing protein n=1 Tax=Nesterenkonia halotolerans TaxID=225325 RepID=A0ABR9J5N3_9MICC|nr:hypothetical protein [Nesterenkonia halotolerans]MBE1514307.1 hypothetical protein [Nesterenkonia halotolerans]